MTASHLVRGVCVCSVHTGGVFFCHVTPVGGGTSFKFLCPDWSLTLGAGVQLFFSAEL